MKKHKLDQEDVTPPIPFWMKRVLRERRVQPTTWQGRRGVLGWGRMEGQGGWQIVAARILKETVGEWGGLSPLVTSQHAQPREFAFPDSVSKHSMPNGSVPLIYTHTHLCLETWSVCEPLTGAFKPSCELPADRSRISVQPSMDFKTNTC